MSDTSAVAFRILGPRATLLGPSNSLENIITNPLPDGALCWVTAEEEYFVFLLNSTATADGQFIIAPSGGPGRWFAMSFLSSGDAASGQQAITAAPVVVTAGNSGELFGAAGLQVTTTVANQRLVVSWNVQRVNSAAGGGATYQLLVDAVPALGVITTTDPDTTVSVAFRAGNTNVPSEVGQEVIIQIATPGVHEINVLVTAAIGDETVNAGAILMADR